VPPDVTVVSASHNNARTLPELCRRIRAALPGCEIIIVDDASTDQSAAVARALGVDVIPLAVRSGQNEAIRAGLARARGHACCVLDADLEDPPEALPALLGALGDGNARVVFSSRDGRRRLTSRVFRRTMRLLYPTLPPRACLCFAIDAASARAVVRAGSPRDYLVAVIGALRLPAAQVRIVREPRAESPSGYAGLKRMRHGLRLLRAAVRLRWQRRAPLQEYRGVDV
jgi:glycosyltransferase involved in cell wall biosynthesis